MPVGAMLGVQMPHLFHKTMYSCPQTGKEWGRVALAEPGRLATADSYLGTLMCTYTATCASDEGTG